MKLNCIIIVEKYVTTGIHAERTFIVDNLKDLTMKTLYSLLTIIILTIGNTVTAQIALTNEIQDVTENKSALVKADELPMITVRYFYYPNLDAYFDTKTSLYIYEDKGEWVQAPQITSGYKGYSIYNGMNVPINDYNGEEPFTKLGEHQKMYPKKYSSRRTPPKEINEEPDLAFN